MDIILYFLQCMQYQHKQICWLLNFICRYIPLKPWAFDDSHFPKYQKFKIDELPLITDFRQDWTYKDLILSYEKRYGKKIRLVSRRSECDIPDDCTCPAVMPQNLFCTKTTVPKDNSSVDNPIQEKRGNCTLFLPSGEDGFGQSPIMGQGTCPLRVLRALP